jgi:hypothetical protein
MKHRKLRIAWSVAWGVVTVLLVTLWVQSYWQFNSWQFGFLHFQSMRGRVAMFRANDWRPWSASTLPLEMADYGFERFMVTRIRGDALDGSDSAGELLVLPDGEPGEYIRGRVPSTKYAVLPWPVSLLLPIGCLISGIAPLLNRRFSLRTLLIATTLVGVGLGLIVWLTR